MRVKRFRPAQPAAACGTALAVLAVLVLGSTPACADPAPGSGTAPPPSAPAGPGKPADAAPAPTVPLPDPPWPPPAVDMNRNQPAQPPRPLHDFHKSTQCIESGTFDRLYKPQPWAHKSLQMEQVHQVAQGAGQSLALIDTGVYKHKFFQDRIKPGGDYVKNTGGLRDCDGHGTEVAGIMAANTHFHGANDNVGFDGMAPKATVYSVRTTSSNFTYKQGDKEIHAGNLRTLGLAVDHLVDTIPDLDAINISLTACVPVGQPVSANYRFLQAAIHHAVAEKNVVVVAAAGNTAEKSAKGCTANNTIPSPRYLKAVPIPAWFGHDVLTVGAMNAAGNPAAFSVHGPWVDVAAPGTDIVSLNPAADNLVNRSVENVGRLNATGQESSGSGGGSRKPMPIQGTSFAAPYVTGLVGLVREKFPWLNAYQVMHRIEMTAVHPATTSGRDNAVGYGMINPMAALTDIVPGEPGPDGAAAPVAHAEAVPSALPPADDHNWTAVIVALAGTGGGVTVLLVTLFVLHTVRRNRRRRA